MLTINIDTINEDLIVENSGNFIGRNNQFAWNSHTKSNQVNQVNGRSNDLFTDYNIIYDDDANDAYINNPSTNSSRIMPLNS